MATPRGAQHRDLEQRLKDLDRELHDIRSTLLRRARLEVSEGDFLVHGGGSVVVTDGGGVDVTEGGDIEVSGGGSVRVHDGDVDVRGGYLITDGAVLVQDSGRLRWTDTDGRLRVQIGGLTGPDNTGPVLAHGLLIQDAGGDDVMYSDDRGTAINSRNDPDHYGLIYTGDGYEDGWYLYDTDGQPMLGTGTTPTDDNVGLWGGKEGNGSLSTLLQFMGADKGSRGLRVRDGANATFADVECGVLTEHTSNESTKDVLGDSDDTALATVRRVPIKRWRYKRGGRSGAPKRLQGRAEPGPEDDTPERIGPMVEDLPDRLVKRTSEGDGIRLGHALWTLWRAVQQLASERDELRDTVHDLADRVARLERRA